jgi:Na+-driven multidrug efflux pump
MILVLFISLVGVGLVGYMGYRLAEQKGRRKKAWAATCSVLSLAFGVIPLFVLFLLGDARKAAPAV